MCCAILCENYARRPVGCGKLVTPQGRTRAKRHRDDRGADHETLRVLDEKFHTTTERLEEIERFLSAVTLHVYPTERIDAVTADRDDNHVLECAVKFGSRVIVSGHQDLLRLGKFKDIDILRRRRFPQSVRKQPSLETPIRL